MKNLIAVWILALLTTACAHASKYSDDQGAWTQRATRAPTTLNNIQGRNLLRSYVYVQREENGRN